MKTTSQHDPRGLIADALALEGLSVEEYRSIFFDWAFGLDDPQAAPVAARALLDLHRSEATAAHPMIALLEEAVAGANGGTGRKGGRARNR